MKLTAGFSVHVWPPAVWQRQGWAGQVLPWRLLAIRAHRSRGTETVLLGRRLQIDFRQAQQTATSGRPAVRTVCRPGHLKGAWHSSNQRLVQLHRQLAADLLANPAAAMQGVWCPLRTGLP